MRAINAKSAMCGLTLRDWIIKVLAFNVEWEKPAETLPVIDRTNTVPDIEELKAEEEGTPQCPDCAMALVWNRQMKRWDCECGYVGKPKR